MCSCTCMDIAYCFRQSPKGGSYLLQAIINNNNNKLYFILRKFKPWDFYLGGLFNVLGM